jgi:hypothetical protein
MTPKCCVTRFIDESGIEHSAELLLLSVYEAAAIELTSFNSLIFSELWRGRRGLEPATSAVICNAP